MGYLLDTNVISELTKAQPNPSVVTWLEAHSVNETYLSVVAVAEIEQGIALLGNTKRARAYRRWLEKLEREFHGHILPIDRAVAHRWAALTAQAIRQGKTLAYADSLIAATALAHNLTIVTRNTADFAAVSGKIVNPWQ